MSLLAPPDEHNFIVGSFRARDDSPTDYPGQGTYFPNLFEMASSSVA